jgi:hypothetical protein
MNKYKPPQRFADYIGVQIGAIILVTGFFSHGNRWLFFALASILFCTDAIKYFKRKNKR